MTETRDNRGILLTESLVFLANEVNNAERKTLTANEHELLFVNGKDTSSSTLSCLDQAEFTLRSVIINHDDFTLALLQAEERP